MQTSMALRIASIMVMRAMAHTPAFWRWRRRCGGILA
jgi:hypothetical protein